MLAALEERRGWDPRRADVVVGTSAGSVVGTLLRGGVAAGDLYGWRGSGARRAPEVAADEPGFTFSPGLVARAAMSLRPGLLAGMLPRGRMPTDGIGDSVRSVVGDRWPSLPLWINAVRLGDGMRVTFGRDGAPAVDPATAVRASCAIPGFFRPVVHDGVEYVDGGIHSPTNADLLAGSGLDLVIVSSPMSLSRSAMRRPSAGNALRLLHRGSLQREVLALRRAGVREVVSLQPGPDDLELMGGTANAMDPRRREAVARQAHATTLRRLTAGVLADLS